MTLSKIFLVLLMSPTMAAASGPALAPYFNFDGVLTDSSGNPITAAGTTIKFRIMDPGETCLLYEEQQTVTPGADGSISVQVGSLVGDAKRSGTNDPGREWADIFQNMTAFGVTSGTCNSGWAPVPGSGRALQVLVNGTTLSPNYALATVPTASVAESLNGKRATDFLQLNMNSGYQLNQANLDNLFYGTNYTNLQNVLAGNVMPASPTSPVNFNGQTLNNVAPPVAATDAANKDYVDTFMGGKALDFNNVNVAMGNGYTIVWDQAQNKWIAAPPTEPGGSFGNIQFNGGGALMGTSALQWDNTNLRLGLLNPNPQATLDVGSGGPGTPIAIFKGTSGQSAPYLMVMDYVSDPKFLVAPSGNVGIGTVSPLERLQIDQGNLAINMSNGSTPAQLIISRSRGSPGAPSDVMSGDFVGALSFSSYYGGAYQVNAQIMGAVDGLPSTYTPSKLVFTTSSSASPPTTRMVISSSGNVGIGTTNPLAKLQVSGAIAGGEKLIPTGAAVDLSLGNTQILQSPGSATLNLSNLAPGGRYRIIIEDSTSRTYTFLGCTNSYFSPTNAATTNRTVYDLTYTSTGSCYIAWTTGYN